MCSSLKPAIRNRLDTGFKFVNRFYRTYHDHALKILEKYLRYKYLELKKTQDIYLRHTQSTGSIALVDRAYPNSSTPNNPLGDNFAKTEKEIEEIVR